MRAGVMLLLRRTHPLPLSQEGERYVQDTIENGGFPKKICTLGWKIGRAHDELIH